MTPIELHKFIQQKRQTGRNLICINELCLELGLSPKALLCVVEVLHDINFVEMKDNELLRLTEAGLHSNLQNIRTV